MNIFIKYINHNFASKFNFEKLIFGVFAHKLFLLHLKYLRNFSNNKSKYFLHSRNVLQYNHTHSDFPLASDILEKYIPKCLIYSILWSFAGDAKLKVRSELGDFIRSVTTVPLPPDNNMPIIDYEVTLEGEWSPWSNKVPQIEVETHKVASPDIVVPTLDTVRHESLLYTWLAEHKPLGMYSIERWFPHVLLCFSFSFMWSTWFGKNHDVIFCFESFTRYGSCWIEFLISHYTRIVVENFWSLLWIQEDPKRCYIITSAGEFWAKLDTKLNKYKRHFPFILIYDSY